MGRVDPFALAEEMTPQLMAWWRAYDNVEPIGVFGAYVSARAAMLETDPKHRLQTYRNLIGDLTSAVDI